MHAVHRLTLVPSHPDATPAPSTEPIPHMDEPDAFVGLRGTLPLRRIGFHLHYGLPAYQGNRDELRIRHLSAIN